MKNPLLEQAKLTLESFNIQDDSIKKALLEIDKINLVASSDSPNYLNIINLLAPYATYWKVSQVLNLLKELVSESREIRQKTYL